MARPGELSVDRGGRAFLAERPDDVVEIVTD
jgi:hypothetical protein